MTPESAAALLQKERYNPEILPKLEAYVEAQCKENTYDLDANLAVLKLYQFHPDTTNVAVVSKILLKALMKLPSTDYITCSYLIPERVQEMELIASIASLASLLETCSFRQFWTAVRSPPFGSPQTFPRRQAAATPPTPPAPAPLPRVRS